VRSVVGLLRFGSLVACSAIEVLWIQTATVASLGGFFFPVLSQASFYEMSVTSRPSKITVDAVVAHESFRQIPI
jgi:hypothetical protein